MLQVNNMITTGLGNDITSIILIVTDGGLSRADSHDAQLQVHVAIASSYNIYIIINFCFRKVANDDNFMHMHNHVLLHVISLATSC